MHDYTKLRVWQRAHRFTVALLRELPARSPRGYPGLRGQVLRAAAAIGAALAEGCGKHSDKELARYADMAIASARELHNHLLLARDARMVKLDRYDRFERERDVIAGMLFGFRRW